MNKTTIATEFYYDVIVAGGGPAGTTASTLLSQQGHKVLLIDRDQHPRFHIGESMLPMSEPIFKRLGVDWQVGQYQRKNGAEFIDEAEGLRIRFPLASQHQPYQVERSKFDLMMIENAAAQGVDVHQMEMVKDISCEVDKVSVRTDKSEYTARYLIDATGRSAMMGRRKKSIQRIDNLGKFSLYTHYHSVHAEAANTLYETGDVKIIIVDIGWIWVIPMAGRRLSVGLVVQKDVAASERKAALFERYLSDSPLLTEALQGAEREFDVRAEADFSFVNKSRHGLRYACCGDSGGFLDPVFSSGVFLAVKTAEMVADRLHEAFLVGKEDNPELHCVDDDDYALGFNSMRMFVERFYHARLVHNLFSVSDRSEELKEDILGLLGGDLWTGKNDFQKKLLNSRQAQKLGIAEKF
ncbi:MAG: tryptophan 7-halogenase [Mariprofundaceae bacterium]|nr:tryptophan 7-halogenase [Mariprofundaceae bacterium]